MKLPRYPVYVPSKGRHETPYTCRFLVDDRVPFTLVVEPQEHEQYSEQFAKHSDVCTIVELPKNNGGLIYARNWIKRHSIDVHDAARHWQLDDNIRCMRMWYGAKRLRCRAGLALGAVEDFVDRYTNVAVAGCNYDCFAHQGGSGTPPTKPFWLNVHVYSCSLILNSLPHEWRLAYNDDTDLCLQVLADGWCTVLTNQFMCDKLRTMTVKGGNTDDLYGGDGRCVMARSLERVWPHVVTTRRRFQRPQHVIRSAWRRFDTPLKRRDDIDWQAIENSTNDYGMRCVKYGEAEVKSSELRALLAPNPRKENDDERSND